MSKKKKSDGEVFLDALGTLIEKPLGIARYHGEVFLTSFGRKNKEMRNYMRQYEQINRKIYLLVLVIAAYGLVIQYSASCYMCSSKAAYNYDPFYLVIRQAVYVVASFVAMWIVQHINYQILFSVLGHLVYTAGLISLALLKTSLAVEVYGAKRWVSVGPIQFAPAEIVKIGVFIMLAYMVQKYNKSLGKMFMTFYMWAIGVVPAVLVYVIANDLSSCAVIMLITFGITLVTTRTWYLHVAAVALIGLLAFIWINHVAHNMPAVELAKTIPFRNQRIVAWLAPETYYSNIGYQTANTLYICGAGGWLGQGLGSFQQLGGLVPIAYTDVIFGVLIYELGIVGAALLMLLYALLLREIYRTIVNAEDMFGSIIGIGVFLHISIQILIHCSVVLNIMPNTGQTLPWFSYGGSNILCLGAEVGLLLSIVRLHQMHYAKAELEGPSTLY